VGGCLVATGLPTWFPHDWDALGLQPKGVSVSSGLRNTLGRGGSKVPEPMGDVNFILGNRQVSVTKAEAQLVHDWTNEPGVALVELQSKITKAVRDAARSDEDVGEVVLTTSDDPQREQLFLNLVEMDKRKSLEDGLLRLKEAAAAPIT
jgi:hypothetical protein